MFWVLLALMSPVLFRTRREVTVMGSRFDTMDEGSMFGDERFGEEFGGRRKRRKRRKKRRRRRKRRRARIKRKLKKGARVARKIVKKTGLDKVAKAAISAFPMGGTALQAASMAKKAVNAVKGSVRKAKRTKNPKDMARATLQLKAVRLGRQAQRNPRVRRTLLRMLRKGR